MCVLQCSTASGSIAEFPGRHLQSHYCTCRSRFINFITAQTICCLSGSIFFLFRLSRKRQAVIVPPCTARLPRTVCKIPAACCSQRQMPVQITSRDLFSPGRSWRSAANTSEVIRLRMHVLPSPTLASHSHSHRHGPSACQSLRDSPHNPLVRAAGYES